MGKSGKTIWMNKWLGFNQSESREEGFRQRKIICRDATVRGSISSGKSKSFCKSGAERVSGGTRQVCRLRGRTFCSEQSSAQFSLETLEYHMRILRREWHGYTYIFQDHFGCLLRWEADEAGFEARNPFVGSQTGSQWINETDWTISL